jgi:hypothetical protein
MLRKCQSPGAKGSGLQAVRSDAAEPAVRTCQRSVDRVLSRQALRHTAQCCGQYLAGPD